MPWPPKLSLFASLSRRVPQPSTLRRDDRCVRVVRLANYVAPASGGLRTALAELGAGYLAAGHEPVLVVPGEANRLYLVNCGICHGTKLDGNGPLYRGGDGPFPAKPATLVGDAKYERMPEGQMYYSVTYGKNKMGSYASQLDTRQRWMVIAYIKAKQAAAHPAAAADSTSKKN